MADTSQDAGVLDLVGEDHLYPTVSAAVGRPSRLTACDGRAPPHAGRSIRSGYAWSAANTW